MLEEARALAADRQIDETYAMGAAKELLQKSLRSWLLDPARELEVVEGEPDEIEGATISITHTLVELVLSDTSGQAADAILPDLDVLLNRSPDFLDLYAPLRLSEDADLIVSKISGERTAQEIADRSEHGANEVIRLLAGLVVTGILEPEQALMIDSDVNLLPADDIETSERRRVPVLWIVGAAALLIIVLAVIAWFMNRSGGSTEGVVAESGREWGLVVDMGCDPQDLQRVLKKAQENPKLVRPVAAESDGPEPCWQLVWGHFPSKQAAESAAGQIPAEIQREGFPPHPVELSGDEVMPPTTSGGCSGGGA